MNSHADTGHFKIEESESNLLEFDSSLASFEECDKYEWALLPMPLDLEKIRLQSRSINISEIDFIVKILMVVLYRNSYQSYFDVPVVNLEFPSVRGELFSNARFEISVDEKIWEVSKHNVAGFSQESKLSIVITNQEISDDHRYFLAPITFVIYCSGVEIRADWIFRKSPQIEAFTSRIRGHLKVVLENIYDDINRSMMAVEMLTEAEIYFQERVGSGQEVKSEFVSLVSWVDAIAENDPGRPAVRFEGVELTYKEVVEKSQCFSAGLKSLGVIKGDRIALLIEPCAEVLVAILGIHRIGAVYVPIDPSFPPARIDTIIDDCQPKIIVTNFEENRSLEELSSIKNSVITLEKLLNYAPFKDFVRVFPEDISHIFFTSGTTGKPKGVVATHANLFHYLGSAVTRYGFDKFDRFIAAAKITFSISLFEILVPLAAGASVTVLSRKNVLDMEAMCRLLTVSTAFHFGPSLLKRVLSYVEENSEEGVFDRISHASTGGDLVPPEILARMQRVFREAETYVIYGCSEISCMGCTFEVPDRASLARTPVGRPHINTGIVLLDIFGNRVPVGAPGGVYFSGPGLVKEYLNRPELSTSRFLDIKGVRHYETGDIGRLNSNGDFEIIGRDDFQVKIRGIRIELQEIERWLKVHPAVSDAVVFALQQADEEKSLVAYLVCKESVTSSQLSGYLLELIPEYMVPTIFVKLDVLPTNHNGKLDRSQLPRPGKENMILSADYQSARNEVENFLVDLWQRLFSLKDVGIDDNFFELGGDSLRAVQMFSEIEKKYDRKIAIDTLLAGPTIRAITEIIRSEKRGEDSENEAISILIKGNLDSPPIFFLYGVLLYRDLAEALKVDRTMYGVSLPEDLDMVRGGHELSSSSAYSSFENIVQKYVNLVKSVQPNGPYLLCGFSFGGMVALEVARELGNQGEEIAMLAMIDSWRPGSMGVLEKMAEHFRMLRVNGLGYLKRIVIKRAAKLKSGVNPIFFGGKNLEDHLVKSGSRVDARKAARSMASRNYSPESYDHKVMLFCARKKSDFQPRSRDLGWKGILKSLVSYEVDGAHFSMLKKENVGEMASIIRREIVG